MLIHQRANHPDRKILEIKVSPFQPGKFTTAKSGRRVEKNHGPLSEGQGGNECLHLLDLKNVRCALTFRCDANTRPPGRASDWIPIREFPSNRTIEDTAHCVPDFLLGAACKWLRSAGLWTCVSGKSAEQSLALGWSARQVRD